jgi:plasmid stabilization system protein ParE
VSDRGHAVVWTEVALRDIERLAAYLVDESPLRAEQILSRIISRGESLQAAPRRGQVPPELRAVGDRTWLQVLESPWRIVYRIIVKRVEIHAVVDGRRSLQDILLDRILNA